MVIVRESQCIGSVIKLTRFSLGKPFVAQSEK